MRALMTILVVLALACATAGCSSLTPGHLTKQVPEDSGRFDPNAVASVEWHW